MTDIIAVIANLLFIFSFMEQRKIMKFNGLKPAVYLYVYGLWIWLAIYLSVYLERYINLGV